MRRIVITCLLVALILTPSRVYANTVTFGSEEIETCSLDDSGSAQLGVTGQKYWRMTMTNLLGTTHNKINIEFSNVTKNVQYTVIVTEDNKEIYSSTNTGDFNYTVKNCKSNCIYRVYIINDSARTLSFDYIINTFYQK